MFLKAPTIAAENFHLRAWLVFRKSKCSLNALYSIISYKFFDKIFTYRIYKAINFLIKINLFCLIISQNYITIQNKILFFI